MSRCHLFLVLSLLSLLLLLATGPAHSSAIRCDQEVDPSTCTYGSYVDYTCRKTVCRKGPSGLCGGKNDRWGKCGRGLMCSNCNRCQGCSYDSFTCWEDKNCIW